MAINTINYDDSLDKIWGILTWEEARLLKDKNAADLAPEVDELLKRLEKVQAAQKKCWRAELIAQAGVDAEDDDIDDTTDEIENELLRIERDRSSARYKRYLKKPRHEIVNLGLESQIEVLRTWPASLKTEPEKVFKQLGGRLEKDIKEGDEVVKERASAAAKTADHRVREIVRFIDDANASRRTRYGILIQRAEELKLSADWPLRFFKKGTKGPKRAKSQPKDGEPGAPPA